jgi:uncharacterized protein (TIGR02284 family)
METEKTTAINALIEINNDRYEGYKTAAEETKDSDLRALFTRFSEQSKGFANDLKRYVPADEAKTDETTNSGKLFRVWMDIKAAVTGKDRKAILASCEFGEDAAKKTYDEVLDNREDLPMGAMAIIQGQRAEIQKGHDTVKAMRDSEK